jgi:four helix bundle protein
MQDFRKLKVWEKSHQLTLEIYRTTQSFPKEELYGLTIQIRRSSASVATNIAEGCGRGSDGDFKRFLQIAMGSASEAEYQILLAHDLGYLAEPCFEQLSHENIEVKQMLASLIRTIKYSTSKTDN